MIQWTRAVHLPLANHFKTVNMFVPSDLQERRFQHVTQHRQHTGQKSNLARRRLPLSRVLASGRPLSQLSSSSPPPLPNKLHTPAEFKCHYFHDLTNQFLSRELVLEEHNFCLMNYRTNVFPHGPDLQRCVFQMSICPNSSNSVFVHECENSRRILRIDSDDEMLSTKHLAAVQSYKQHYVAAYTPYKTFHTPHQDHVSTQRDKKHI